MTRHVTSSVPTLDQRFQWSLFWWVISGIVVVLVLAPLLSLLMHTLYWLFLLLMLIPLLLMGWRMVRYAFPLK
jgi:hypothetical protein